MPNSKPVLQFSDKVRLELNKLLGDLQDVESAAAQQQEALVPEMDSVLARCAECRERIQAFKAVNFPGKK